MHREAGRKGGPMNGELPRKWNTRAKGFPHVRGGRREYDVFQIAQFSFPPCARGTTVLCTLAHEVLHRFPHVRGGRRLHLVR